MSQTLTLSDEAYRALAELASAKGQTPESLIEAWISDAEAERNPYTQPRYQTFDEFFHDLGMSDEQIEDAKAQNTDADL